MLGVAAGDRKTGTATPLAIFARLSASASSVGQSTQPVVVVASLPKLEAVSTLRTSRAQPGAAAAMRLQAALRHPRLHSSQARHQPRLPLVPCLLRLLPAAFPGDGMVLRDMPAASSRASPARRPRLHRAGDLARRRAAYARPRRDCRAAPDAPGRGSGRRRAHPERAGSTRACARQAARSAASPSSGAGGGSTCSTASSSGGSALHRADAASAQPSSANDCGGVDALEQGQQRILGLLIEITGDLRRDVEDPPPSARRTARRRCSCRRVCDRDRFNSGFQPYETVILSLHAQPSAV